MFRRLWKWIIHKFTELTEVERIFLLNSRQSCIKSYDTIHNLEYSMEMSTNHKEIISYNSSSVTSIKTIEKYLASKNISLHIYSPDLFYRYCMISLDKIMAYKDICKEIEMVRRIPFAENNIIHQNMLKQLWTNLMCSNGSKDYPGFRGSHWMDIGFQGENPSTDFRGMGILGLMNLLFFSEFHGTQAQQIVQYCLKPQNYSYPLAIVGINLTSMTRDLFIDGTLKYYFYDCHFEDSLDQRSLTFYNHDVGEGTEMISEEIQCPTYFDKKHKTLCNIDLIEFHKIYSYLLLSFHHFWISREPRDIMEFSRIRDEFYDYTVSQIMSQRVTDIN